MNELIDRPPTELAENWMLLVFLLCLIVLARIRTVYAARLTYMWHAAFNVRLMRQGIREEYRTPAAYQWLSTSFFILAGLLLYLTLKYYGISPMGQSGVILYLLLVIVVAMAYLIKNAGVFLVQWLSDGDFGLSEYRYSTTLIYRLFGVLLLPVVLMIAYSPLQYVPALLATGYLLFFLSVIYRILKGTVSVWTSGVPSFYIFFYICTLEFLPFLILYRFLFR